MWFKNLRIYCLTDELPCPPEQLEGKLQDTRFVACSSLDTSRVGWVPPMGPDAELLVHSCAGFHLFCARTQQKLLPPGAIREVLDEKVRELEASEGRKLRRKERMDLKDEIVHSLLPRALTRSHLTWAFLAENRRLLLIDSATPARAEELLNLLRDALGRLAVRPLVPRQNPSELMTRWLSGGRLPKSLSLGVYCDLRDPLHAANVVRARQQELASQEIRAHIDAGKQVVGLGLGWKDRLSFVLSEDLALRGLKFSDVTQRDAALEQDEDAAARFDAEFALMSLEIDALAGDLIGTFGTADA
jgi:recombination associated protein RdgC